MSISILFARGVSVYLFVMLPAGVSSPPPAELLSHFQYVFIYKMSAVFLYVVDASKESLVSPQENAAHSTTKLCTSVRAKSN